MGEDTESGVCEGLAKADTDKMAGDKSGRRDSGIEEEIAERITRLKLSNDLDNNESKNTSGVVTDKESVISETKEDQFRSSDSGEGGGSDSESKADSPRDCQCPGRMSPAEFFHTSRLRSGALANKLNTTGAFGGSTELFQAVPNDNDASQLQKLTKELENVSLDGKATTKDGEERLDEVPKVDEASDKELIDRSPLPVHANNRFAHHPYQQAPQQRANNQNQAYFRMKANENAGYSPSSYMEQQRYKASGHCGPLAIGAQPRVAGSPGYFDGTWSPVDGFYNQQEQPFSYGSGQSCLPACQEATKAAGFSDISPPTSLIGSAAELSHLVASSSPLQALSPFDFGPMPPIDGAEVWKLDEKLVEGNQRLTAESRDLDIEQLPDELSDFILTYSRYYSGNKESIAGDDATNFGSSTADCNDSSTNRPRISTSNGYESTGCTPSAVDSSATSEVFSPSTTFYTNSPNAASPSDGREQRSPTTTIKDKGSARERLRERVSQKDLDAAWAWAMRCSQTRPEALFFRDKDGDSLLHIVVWHKDLAKVYVLTEIMLKHHSDIQAGPKLFDLPNKSNETPLYLAVEKGLADVVDYFLECGADATIRSKHGDADPPIHYAAARGMPDVVRVLCASGKCSANILNGAGITPLLSAVKNHGNVDEEMSVVNNGAVIKTLLKAGADATIQDAASGKNILHYCVERLSPDLAQLFADCLDKRIMSRLVNSPDYNSFTPMALISGLALSPGGDPGKEKAKEKIWKIFVDYGRSDQVNADDFGDLSFLLSDQCQNDGVQFALLSDHLSSAY